MSRSSGDLCRWCNGAGELTFENGDYGIQTASCGCMAGVEKMEPIKIQKNHKEVMKRVVKSVEEKEREMENIFNALKRDFKNAAV